MILFNGTAYSGIILYLHFQKLILYSIHVTFCIVVFSACGIVSHNQSFMLVLLFGAIFFNNCIRKVGKASDIYTYLYDQWLYILISQNSIVLFYLRPILNFLKISDFFLWNLVG